VRPFGAILQALNGSYMLGVGTRYTELVQSPEGSRLATVLCSVQIQKYVSVICR